MPDTPFWKMLRVIDRLLLDYMRSRGLQPADLENDGGSTSAAMDLLREAYYAGQYEKMTATWTIYFDETKETHG